MGDAEPHPAQLLVEPADLLESRLDVADVGDLAAQVEVHQPEAVLPARGHQLVEQAHELDRAEPELGLLATALGPASRPLGGELDPDPDIG